MELAAVSGRKSVEAGAGQPVSTKASLKQPRSYGSSSHTRMAHGQDRDMKKQRLSTDPELASPALFPAATQLPGKPPALPSRHVLGVSLKQGGYVAQLRLVPYLQVVTRCEASRQKAVTLHQVLSKARGLAAGETSAELQAALEEACSERDLAVSELGLSFCAVVDAHAVVGCTVAGSHSASLAEALEQREQLLAARDAGWPCLRQTWVRIMQVQVQQRSSRAWGRGCPQAKAAEVAEQIADKAWQAHSSRQHMREASRSSAHLAQAVRAVQRALQEEDRAALAVEKRGLLEAVSSQRRAARAARREEKQRREAKWRWLKDPQRTVGDLLLQSNGLASGEPYSGQGAVTQDTAADSDESTSASSSKVMMGQSSCQLGSFGQQSTASLEALEALEDLWGV
ncbi:unnamed protein product [Polarella glacialis]|uniref:Uncharacterized protein n=1 Tax=Polarella glacialis TaxID=89957 RepID=A0A813G7J0_POLGL|nr:unnamed protein product [Polarella glacialis]CAE8674043.1 unnamed protein product [Polarella glacialis]